VLWDLEKLATLLETVVVTRPLISITGETPTERVASNVMRGSGLLDTLVTDPITGVGPTPLTNTCEKVHQAITIAERMLPCGKPVVTQHLDKELSTEVTVPIGDPLVVGGDIIESDSARATLFTSPTP
jgi:hypothetical protein